MRTTDDGVQLLVRVQAGAAKSGIVGQRDGRVLVRVSAPALQGRANAAVVELLAKTLGVRKSAISVRRGTRHRDKELIIVGMAREQVENHLC